MVVLIQAYGPSHRISPP